MRNRNFYIFLQYDIYRKLSRTIKNIFYQFETVKLFEKV